MLKVLCPGEALIDFVANENKLLQDSENFLKKAGGAPANVAGAIAKFGVEPYFMGNVGDDAFGYFLINQMQSHNINTKYMGKLTNQFTTLAFVSIDENAERDFIFSRGADQMLEIKDENMVDEFDCIHFASATAFLGGSLEKSYDRLLELAIEKKKIVTFDANYRSALFENNQEYFIKKCKDYIAKSNIVKLSEEEAVLISGIDDLKSAGLKISQLGCEYLIVTLGSKGTYIFHQGEVIHVETIKISPLDTTGAGDAFIGAVVAQIVLSEELTLNKMIEIVKLANKVGAITTKNYGALESIPDIEQIKKLGSELYE